MGVAPQRGVASLRRKFCKCVTSHTGARAVQISKQTEDPPPLRELTLTIPRYPCRTFADRLRQYRRKRGWRQVDLAHALEVNTPKLGHLITIAPRPDHSIASAHSQHIRTRPRGYHLQCLPSLPDLSTAIRVTLAFFRRALQRWKRPLARTAGGRSGRRP